jgi:hypothetical protein
VTEGTNFNLICVQIFRSQPMHAAETHEVMFFRLAFKCKQSRIELGVKKRPRREDCAYIQYLPQTEYNIEQL